MTRVRRHVRQAPSGRTVRVREYERDTGEPMQPVYVDRPPSSAPPAEGPREHPPGTVFFDDGQGHRWAVHPDGSEHLDRLAEPDPDSTLGRMVAQMREWRARPEPPRQPAEHMTPEMARAMGCHTAEGRDSYERGRAYRAAGYSGPLGPGHRIADPDDPDVRQALEALADMEDRSR